MTDLIRILAQLVYIGMDADGRIVIMLRKRTKAEFIVKCLRAYIGEELSILVSDRV